jgi:hypothetical protein
MGRAAKAIKQAGILIALIVRQAGTPLTMYFPGELTLSADA